MPNDDLFIKNYPSLDLHGETRFTMIAPLDSFINDNLKLKNRNIVIIHGKGEGVLKRETHEYLKKDKRIKSFYQGMYNEGCTICELNLDKSYKKVV